MRLGYAWALILVLCLGGPFWVQPAYADTCTFCDEELEEGVKAINCPNCIKISTQITKRHKKVWVLGFKQGKIRPITIKKDTGDQETFWYMPYTLTNNDTVPHPFFIDITAISDRGRNKFRYRDIHVPLVYKELRLRLGIKEEERLLSKRTVSMIDKERRNEPPEQVRSEDALSTFKSRPHERFDPDGRTKIGDKFLDEDSKVGDSQKGALMRPEIEGVAKISLPMIQPGESIKCVAIFNGFHPEMDRLVIHVRGLANSNPVPRGLKEIQERLEKKAGVEKRRTADGTEVSEVKKPVGRFYIKAQGEAHRIIVRETILELHYGRPGDEFAHGVDPIRFISRKWVERGFVPAAGERLRLVDRVGVKRVVKTDVE